MAQKQAEGSSWKKLKEYYGVRHGYEPDIPTYNQERHIENRKILYELLDKLPRGARVLSVGGGDGSVSIHAERNGLSATMIDITPEAIEKASRFAMREGVNPTLIEDDFIRHDFGGQKFDFIEMTGVLHHFSSEEKEKVLAKILSLLTPDGEFAFLGTYKLELVKEGKQTAFHPEDNTGDFLRERGFDILHVEILKPNFWDSSEPPYNKGNEVLGHSVYILAKRSAVAQTKRD